MNWTFGATCWLNLVLQLTQHQFSHTHTHLGRGIKGGVHSNLWHVPVVDVLVAVPNTVDQVSLVGKKNDIKENLVPF